MSQRNPLDNLLARIANNVESDSDSDYEDDLVNTFQVQSTLNIQPIIGQQNCYEVESILNVRMNGNRREFLIRWSDSRFPDEWLDQDNVNSSLIQRFELQQQVQQHNAQVRQNQSSLNLPTGTTTGKAYLYTRVSDKEKTKGLYLKSCAQQARETQNSTGNSTENSTQNFTQSSNSGLQSFQTYCADFPSGNFSLDYQKNTGFKYCLKHNLEIAMIEMDDGITARNPDKLPGLQDILATIQSGDYLIFTDFSRFTRHTLKGIQILDTLHLNGVFIRSVLDEISYDTPAARHNARQAMSSAQFYSELSGQKTKEAKQNIKSKGGFIGGLPPFGHKVYRDNNIRKLKEKRSEQIVIKFVASQLGSGKIKSGTYAKLANTLNKQNHRYRGKRFSSTNIGSIACRIRKTSSSTTQPVSYLNNQIRREMTALNQNQRRKDQRQARLNQNRMSQNTFQAPSLSLTIKPVEMDQVEMDSRQTATNYNLRPRVSYQPVRQC